MIATWRLAWSTIGVLLLGGAALRWGVSGQAAGIGSDTAGTIVMVAGLIGAFAAVLVWSSRGSASDNASEPEHWHLRG